MSSRAQQASSAALLALLAASGCGEASGSGPDPGPLPAEGGGLPAGAPSPEPAAPLHVERAVRDLVTALTPLAPDVPRGEQDAWYLRRARTLERLRSAGPEIGREALAVLGRKTGAPAGVRSGLLEVAAHNLPEEVAPFLVELVTGSGEDLGLRARACQLLGETAPERAIEVLAPILTAAHRDRTYPPDDRMVETYVEAAQRTGADATPVLAELVLDTRKTAPTRHFAARGLGELPPTTRGRAALESVVVDSGGNHYLRRIAVQSLLATVAPEETCPFFERILENEADTGFRAFVADVLADRCGR